MTFPPRWATVPLKRKHQFLLVLVVVVSTLISGYTLWTVWPDNKAGIWNLDVYLTIFVANLGVAIVFTSTVLFSHENL